MDAQVAGVAARIAVNAARAEEPGCADTDDAASFLESRCASMARALAIARRVAPSDVTVLLTGESGTGKSELAARMHAWSARRAGPLIAVPCTALTPELFEAELLGITRKRPTAPAGATLFLHEITDLSADLQARLVRLLEERRFRRSEVDARVIAATNRDLEAEVHAGRFRDDLFFRLNVVSIRLPPLRERREDLAGLTDEILAQLGARRGRSGVRLDPVVRDVLAIYDWPGNTRELVNVLEAALAVSEDDVIALEHLPDRLLEPRSVDTPAPVSSSLGEVERRHIERVLANCGTLQEAASRLGINATTLWRKRKRYGLQ